jgi:hypothetical protein
MCCLNHCHRNDVKGFWALWDMTMCGYCFRFSSYPLQAINLYENIKLSNTDLDIQNYFLCLFRSLSRCFPCNSAKFDSHLF